MKLKILVKKLIMNAKYPNLRWLTNGGKVTIIDFPKGDLSFADIMVGRLRKATVSGLRDKYAQDVQKPDDLDWLFSEIRVAALLQGFLNDRENLNANIKFIKREKKQTPDLSLTIQGETVGFEISRIQDDKLSPSPSKSSYTSVQDEIEQVSIKEEYSFEAAIKLIDAKLQSKITQAKSIGGKLVVVVDPHPMWNSGFILQNKDISSLVTKQGYELFSGIMILYQSEGIAVKGREVSRPKGLFVSNPKALAPLTSKTDNALNRMLSAVA